MNGTRDGMCFGHLFPWQSPEQLLGGAAKMMFLNQQSQLAVYRLRQLLKDPRRTNRSVAAARRRVQEARHWIRWGG